MYFIILQRMSDDYVVPKYEVSDTVKSMHDVWRTTSNNIFSTTDQEYIDGLLFIAVPYFFVALLILISVPLWLCIQNTCPETQVEANNVQQQETNTRKAKWFAAKRVIFVLTWLIMLVGICVALGGNANAELGITECDDAISTHSSILSNVDDNLRSFRDMSNDGLDVILSSNLSECNVNADAVITELDELSASLQGYLNQTADLSDAIQSLIKENAEYPRNASNISLLVLSLLLGLMSICAIIALACYNRSILIVRISLATAWIAFPVSIICAIILWCVTGVNMSLAVGTADFCMNPDTYVVDLAVDFGYAATSNITRYYIDCRGENVLETNMEECQDLSLSSTELLSALIVDLEASECSDNITVLMEELEISLNNTLAIYPDLLAEIECSHMNPSYINFRTYACINVIEGFTLLWIGQFVLVIGFLITILTHPSQKEQKEEVQSQYVEIPSMGNEQDALWAA